MRYESEIFFSAPLHLEGSLRRIGLDRHSNRLVEDPVHDVERLALQADAVLLGEIVNTAAQNVVLRHDLFQIKSFLKPLQSMSCGTASFERLGDCRARL